MHAHGQIMANQHGRNGSTHDDKEGWRRHGEPPRRRDDEPEDREAERRGMGQSGYGAGRSADDRSIGTQVRNTAWDDERGERDYGRGRWEEGRIGMTPGYGYQDGDRPSFERGLHDPRFGGMREHSGSGGPYRGGGYEPDPRSAGSREQDRSAFSHDQGGYRQHQRGPHRGKGPKGFEPSDERIRERVCEALSDDHNIDASNIEVSVHKGEVTLTGTIDDRDTKRMAEDCVLQCSGVRDVHNQLRVPR